MTDAKTLLLEFLAAVTRGQNAAALFAEDGAVELPFLHSLGIPWRHRGRQAISELQASLAGLYLDFAFKPEDTHVLIDTQEQVFAEYMAHPTARATGRTVSEPGRRGPGPSARRRQGPARSGESDLLGPPGLPELRPSRVLFQHRQSSSLSRKHGHGRQRADRPERLRGPLQQTRLGGRGALLVEA
jgi:hypothetical protein